MTSQSPRTAPPECRSSIGTTQPAAPIFRPRRVAVHGLGAGFRCELVTNVARHRGDVLRTHIADVSETGLGIDVAAMDAATLRRQPRCDAAIYRGQEPIWRGAVELRYSRCSPSHRGAERIGLKIVEGRLDLKQLELDELFRQLELGFDHDSRRRMDYRAQRELPTAWRSAVGEARSLLQELRTACNLAESRRGRSRFEVATLIELHQCWAARLYAKFAQLETTSGALSPVMLPVAREYAARQLLPALSSSKCGEHSAQVRLDSLTDFFARRLQSPSLYTHFLHYAAERWSHGRARQGRKDELRQVILHTVENKPPGSTLRVVCLQAAVLSELSGALEHLASSGSFHAHSLDIVLADTDKIALERASNRIGQIIQHSATLRNRVRFTTIECRVNELLRAESPRVRKLLNDHLHDSDLILSETVLDNLQPNLIKQLTAKLYSNLRPGGRLFLLRPDRNSAATWLVDYALNWHLSAVSRWNFHELAEQLSPRPEQFNCFTDAGAQNLFFDLHRPKLGRSIHAQTSIGR